MISRNLNSLRYGFVGIPDCCGQTSAVLLKIFMQAFAFYEERLSLLIRTFFVQVCYQGLLVIIQFRCLSLKKVDTFGDKEKYQ